MTVRLLLPLFCLQWVVQGAEWTRADAQAALDRAAKVAVAATPAARAQSRTLLRTVLDWSIKARDKTIEARAAALTANTHHGDNEPLKAIAWYERSRQAATAAGDEVQRVRALNNLAIQRWISGDALRALDELRAVLPLRHALKDRPGMGYTLSGIAGAQYSLGDLPAALESYRELIALWTELKDIGNEAQAHSSAGLVLDELGDSEAARVEYDRALVLWRAAKLTAGEAMTLNNLCLWSIGRRAYTEATGFCEQALALLERAGDRRSQAYAWHNLGSAQAGLGQHRKAIEWYERSLKVKREIGDLWGEAASHQAAAESLLALGDLAAGRARLADTLRRRLAIGDRAGQIQTYGALARAQRDAGEHAAALANVQQAIRRIETTRAQLASQDRRASFLATRRDYYELQADLQAQLGQHPAAIASAEQARGRQLLDRLADTLAGLQKNIDPALAARRRVLEQRLHARLEQLQRAPSSRAASVEVDALLLELRDVDERLRRTHPRLATLVQPRPIGFPQLRALLGADATLLQWMSGSARSHAWLITPGGAVRHTVLPGRAEVERRVRALFDKLAARGDTGVETAALTEAVLGPWRNAFAPGRRLVVAADGPAESVPFAALLPGVEIVHAPSLTALALLRSGSRPEPKRSLAILADPVFSNPSGEPQPGDLPRLRFSRVEAESIAAMAQSPAVALGFEASRDWISRAGLSDFRVVHFATHAFANAARPTLSGIQLARYATGGQPVDGLLRLPEIYNLDLRARLVVLSACRSAVGAELPGEGLVSLTRGFLYAGAAAVVATLWDVDDRATAELMRRFYDGWLKRGLAPGVALREAQAAVRAVPQWRHPFYWAGVTLHGEWR